MFMLNDKSLALDTAFTVGEGDEAIQYPANWLRLASPEERTALGITEVADAASYDDRFFWGVDNPKDLSDLKPNWSAQVKDTTNKLLAATDWMVIRKAERGVAIPADTVAYRAAVLAECDRLLAAITVAANVQELTIVLSNQAWPEVK